MRSDRLRALLLSASESPPYALRAAELGAGLPPGLWTVDVEHDDDCRIFRGRACTCSPRVLPPRPYTVPA
jgi:hypothetical protein